MRIGKWRQTLFSIENKILLPFVMISVLAMLALFGLLYGMQHDTWEAEGMAIVFYEQRYLILGSIAFLLVLVQAAVLVAYNIAGPIRELSGICARVSMDPGRYGMDDQETALMEDYVMRSDEVGQLAAAFGMMMGSLGRYTDELSFLKGLNESIVENLPLGVIAFGENGEELLRNSRADIMLANIEETDDTGRNLSDILAGMLEKNEVLPEPARLRDADGRVRDLEFGSWKPLDGEKKETGSLYTIDDVTYKRRMEEKASLDEKLAYTGQLAADVAHEAKNPLAGIRAGLQVIGRHLDGEKDRKLCTEMIKEVDRVNLLIENLVNLSRQRESEKTVVDLNALFDEILLLYLKVAENKGVALKADIAGRIWLVADEQELKQILINLINNSIKAMPSGGTLWLSAKVTEEGVFVSVRDSGSGMTEETRERVLRGEGGGLGLSIVRRLTEQNGGSFELESVPGQGTCAVLTFRGIEGTKNTAVKAGGRADEI